MTSRIVATMGTALIFLTVAAPAMAAVAPIQVPEPASMTLFGLGVAGAFVTRKFIGRK
jgi:PEP-CTERM motif-containing protein